MSAGQRLAGMVLGAVAGAAATWLMSKVTTYLYDREDPAARAREESVRGGRSSGSVAAEKLAGLVGRDLDDHQLELAGNAVHWAIGIGTGALYGLLRTPRTDVGVLRGLALGTGFFLVADEAINTAFGFTPPPRAFPWQAHARGLAGHVTWGLATEAGVAALAKPLAGRAAR